VSGDQNALGFGAKLHFHMTVFQVAGAYIDAHGDSQEIGIFEFHARPEVSVVHEDIEALFQEFP